MKSKKGQFLLVSDYKNGIRKKKDKKCYLCKKTIKKSYYKGYDYGRKKKYDLCKSCSEIGLVILKEMKGGK